MSAFISLCYRNGFIPLLFILIYSISLTSCSSKTGPSEADEIRIGMTITTAEERMRANGWNVLDLYQIRLKEKQGFEIAGKRYPVKFVTREIKGGVPEQAVRAVSELINQEGVLAIVGPYYSMDAIPAGEVAEKSGIPFISPTSIHAQTTAGRRYVFRAAFLDTFQAREMARFCVKELGARSIAVLYNKANPYSRGLAETFKKTVDQEEGQITSYESYVTGENVFTDQLERIKDSEPEVLYLPNLTEETESIATQARDLRIGAVLLGSNAWDYPKFLGLSQFSGSHFTAHMSPGTLTGENKALSEEYQSRYGLELDDGVALTYDTIGLILAALRHAGSFEPDAIRDALYEMGPYEGVTGKIDFIDSGDPVRDAVILRIDKDEIRFVKRIMTRQEE